MNLKVGIDADGVLTDMSEFLIREGKEFFKKQPKDSDAYSVDEMFEITKIQKIRFGLTVFDKYCKYESPRPYAPEIIRKLNNEGYEMHSITARMFTDMPGIVGARYRGLLKKYYKNYNMDYFKSIQFCSEKFSPRDKLIACSKLNIDVMIDDKPEVVLELARNGIKVLMFDAPYNKNIEHENIIRVKSWLEVYDRLKEIEKSKNIKTEFKKLSLEERSLLTKEQKNEYFKSYRNYLKNLQINKKMIEKGNRRFKIMYSTFKLPVMIKFRSKVFGKENVPYQNGFIIASNHVNSSDQWLIGNKLGNRAICGFAASTIKNTFRGRIFELVKGAVFIDRNDKLSKSNGEEELAKRIAHDQIALIFPEGTRKNKTEEGRKKEQLPFKLGTVSIAQKTGAPILPTSIYYGKKYKIVRFGEPFIVKPDEDLIEANKKLENTVLNMTRESVNYEKTKLKKK